MLPWLVLLSAAVVTPSPRPTPPVLKFPAAPPAQLQALAAFEGTWACEATGTGTNPSARAEIAIRRDLGGFWLAGRAVERAGEEATHTRLFFWSYDEVLGKFVGGWLDSRGGWSAQTSIGWEGDDKDTLVFLGHVTATGEKVTARETFTRPQDGAFVRRYEVLGFIEWSLVTEERCRQGPPSLTR
jgi:hypothetical protein